MPKPFPFESLFMCGPAASCLLSPDSDAAILTANLAYLAVTGRSLEELVGTSLFDAFPGDPRDTADTGVAALRTALDSVLNTGHPYTLPMQRYPIRVAMPDGSSTYEERYWNAVSTPIFDPDGTLSCIMHTIADVSDKARSEAALRESEGRMRAFITTTADVVYRMSPDWRYMHGLDGRGFLKTTTSWDEYHIEEYVHAEDVELARTAIETAIRTKGVFELEHRVVRVDGSEGWTYSKAVPLLDADGAIREWVGAASDITQRKLAELKLKQLDKRKDDFLAMLAHELRNPLAPISAAAELLLRTGLDKERTRRTSEIIGRQVRHMTGLVDDLLDVSRVTRGRVQLENATVGFNQIVSDALEQSHPLLQAHRQHLDLRLTAEEALVTGDPKRLIQVVANLVNNAAKYTPAGGHIVIRTEVNIAHVILEVEDDGKGIEAGVIGHVFDLFAQAEVTSDRSSGGLGLGLALVKSLVELHGGSVECHSEGLGKGSKFTVRLPRLIERTDHATPADAGAPASWHTARPLRLMVVDDNADAAETLSMLLEAAGHEVFLEHSAGRALERARAEVPDVCLLDIGLPEMDGNELAQRLRKQAHTANAVLIAVTGYGQEEDRRRSLRSGFNHHLVKPIDATQLMAILEKIVAQPHS